MKKKSSYIYIALSFAAVLVTLFSSRPDREQQLTVVIQETRISINSTLDSLAVAQLPYLGPAIAEGGRMLGDQVAQGYLDRNYHFKDCYLWSTGSIEVGGRQRNVVLGVLGHVFVYDQDSISQALTAALRDKAIETAIQIAKAIAELGVGS